MPNLALNKLCSKAATCNSPVAERGHKVEAAVDSIVLDVASVEAALILEVLVELLLYVLSDRLPTVTREYNTGINRDIHKAGSHYWG